jgi:hypothetical protein
MLDSEKKALRSFETSGNIYTATQVTSQKTGIFCDVCILLVSWVAVHMCYAGTLFERIPKQGGANLNCVHPM